MAEPIVMLCRILDAQFKELLEDENNNPIYENSILIRLKSEENDFIYRVALSEPQVRDLVRLSRPLSSGEMVQFAIKLRERTEAVRLMVDPASIEVDSEMIAAEGPDNSEPVAKFEKRKTPARKPKVDPGKHKFTPKTKQPI
jgi:hypothetical protein